MTEMQEKLVDECLDEMNVTDTERRADFKNFLIQCGMFNPNVKWYNRIIGTKSNMKALYKKLDNPVKRASKILGLEYRELAEKIGYSERGLKNAVVKGEVSKPMERAIELLLEVEQHKKTIQELKDRLDKTEVEQHKKTIQELKDRLDKIESAFKK